MKDVGEATGDMASALTWFQSMGAAKQKHLIEIATGTTTMTQDAVAVLTETVGTEVGTLVSLEGLSKAAQSIAKETFENTQALYDATMAAAVSIDPSLAVVMADLKRHEFLASRSVVAAKAWAEATKIAIGESANVKIKKKTGGNELKLANESYDAAVLSAREKLVEAIQLSAIYLTAAQKHMVALRESEQGQRLWKRTKTLLDVGKLKAAELRKPLVMVSPQWLVSNCKVALKSVRAAQDWVVVVLLYRYQKEEKKAKKQVVAQQMELVRSLEQGLAGW